MVKKALAAIADNTPEERQSMRQSVMGALDAFVTLMPSRQFTKEQADNFAHDMCLLYALNSMNNELRQPLTNNESA